MSAPAGWYPDPAEPSGGWRYWDGHGWSDATRPASGVLPRVRPRARSRVGWAIGGVAALVVLVVLGVLVVRQVGGVVSGGLGPGGTPSSNVCPVANNASPVPQPNDGRVHGGRLFYPQLGPPWSAPRPRHDVAFGRGVLHQFVEIEHGSFLQFPSWGADVLVGELAAGDGFFAPKDGAAIVVTCLIGALYGNTEVSRDDRKSQALGVDGHDAWVIETNLGFDIPNLQAKHELLIVVVVDTGDGTAGLFCASVPENGPRYVPPARQALAALRVDG